MNKGALRFYKKIRDKKYNPKNICEIGVYLPQESNVIGFINENIQTTLIEADPVYVSNIKDYFAERNNITVIEAAVFDFKGEVELCKRASSTFISQLKSSPAMVNDDCNVSDEEKFTANSIVFSEVDKGTFDLVSIDIEGAEWYVIKYMISRPDIISIETHGKYYTNPNIIEIINWMRTNNYIEWYKDKSDTIYIKRGVFPVSIYEKLQLFFVGIVNNILKMKKLIKKYLKID